LKSEDFDPEGTTDAVRSFQSSFEFYCAMHAFEQRGEESVFDAVRHAREGWRSAAVTALSRIGDERAKAALEVLTGDPVESVRSSARYELEWLERKGSGSSGPSVE
jgi:HEAT repeat protein